MCEIMKQLTKESKEERLRLLTDLVKDDSITLEKAEMTVEEFKAVATL